MGGRTSHLFGTVHVGLDLDAALHDAGRVALDEAKRVFVEFDLTSPPAIVALIYDALARAELPPNRSLRAPQAGDLGPAHGAVQGPLAARDARPHGAVVRHADAAARGGARPDGSGRFAAALSRIG